MTAGDLAEEILTEEARLDELTRRRDDSRRRLDQLRAARDDGGEAETADAAMSSDSWFRERKLKLFERLFQGRPDVFPKRWENAKGRSGWAPSCANEWKPGVCEKPRVKCGECPNQAFTGPAEHVLRAHLEGHHVMGVYPLLADDTCRLLAIDLDGRAWREDVTAIREACEELAVQPAVERSRSGQGAHIWFFFGEAVPAASARRFGLMLLTDAMARAPTLTMGSYDRLFPSQDVLPKGGFGNLIALPLQREARQQGNTLFLDEQLEPYADQWGYLDNLPLIDAERLDDLVATGKRDSLVLAVGEESPDDAAPWRPSRPLADRLAKAALPATVQATLAHRLYVKRADLPPPLHDAMRRLACFSNPKFFELQRMRFSTARTPRVISCFGEEGDFLALPRGCLEQLEGLLNGLGIELELEDERSDGADLDACFVGELDPAQGQAAKDMLDHDLGVLCAPPGNHVPAVTTERVLQAAPARFVTGLTATPRRRDGHHPIVAMQCGPARHTMAQGTTEKHALQLRVVRRDTGFDPSVLPTKASIQEVFAALAEDDERTRLIADEALELVGRGRSPIVLTERRDHLERLQAHLRLKAYRSLRYEVEEPRSASGIEPLKEVSGGIRTLLSGN